MAVRMLKQVNGYMAGNIVRTDLRLERLWTDHGLAEPIGADELNRVRLRSPLGFLPPKQEPNAPRLSDALPSDAFADAPRVIVLGSGPSLNEFDWSLLEGEVVIGANRAFERPHVGMVVSVDTRGMRWIMNGQEGEDVREKWRAFPGMKVVAVPPHDQKCGECLWVECHGNKPSRPFVPTLENLGPTDNSGHAALLVAMALGAKNIWLLGMDMQGRGGKQAWCHKPWHIQEEDDTCYLRYRERFEKTAITAKQMGVKIEVFGDSALECFPKFKLATAMRRLKKERHEWPLVLGYYTKDTPYQAEAETMRAHAAVFGLQTYLCEVPNLHDWDANTRQKCKVIQDTLVAREAPILYLDADSRIRRYPKLMAVFLDKHDCGIGWIDWAALPGNRTDRELLNACMAFAPTAKTFELLDRWCAMVEANRGGAWEQKQLEQAIAETPGLRVREIPMAYNQIYDLMRANSARPVIEQMQASRKYREAVSV